MKRHRVTLPGGFVCELTDDELNDFTWCALESHWRSPFEKLEVEISNLRVAERVATQVDEWDEADNLRNGEPTSTAREEIIARIGDAKSKLFALSREWYQDLPKQREEEKQQVMSMLLAQDANAPWVTYRAIMDAVGLSRNTVARVLKQLDNAGQVLIRQQGATKQAMARPDARA